MKKMGELQVLPRSPVSVEQSGGGVKRWKAEGYWDVDFPSPFLSHLPSDLLRDITQGDNKMWASGKSSAIAASCGGGWETSCPGFW